VFFSPKLTWKVIKEVLDRNNNIEIRTNLLNDNTTNANNIHLILQIYLTNYFGDNLSRNIGESTFFNIF